MTDNSPLGGETTTPLRLGTRRSKLAMAQSGMVADAVREVTGRAVELVEITTYGDVSREHLAQIGGTGVFVAALREALLSGEVDFAVHSLKDLPTTQPEGLVLAAVPTREDPRDALVARDGLTFEQLPPGARIGTGSPRRMAQLNAYARSHGLEIETVAIRGNVDTRIGFVRSGSWTRWFSPPPGSAASDARTRSPASCRSTPSCPLPAREHWRSNALKAARTSPQHSPSSTIRTPGSP